MSDHRLGIVVEGGGIRGIYAAGVLDVLSDLNLPVKGVIGVSAAFTAVHLSPAKKAEVFVSTNAFAAMTVFSVLKH